MIELLTQFRHIVHTRSLTLTMEFSNLWKYCYGFTHAFYHKVQNYVPFRYQHSPSRALAYLPRNPRSTAKSLLPLVLVNL